MVLCGGLGQVTQCKKHPSEFIPKAQHKERVIKFNDKKIKTFENVSCKWWHEMVLGGPFLQATPSCVAGRPGGSGEGTQAPGGRSREINSL